jgi:hypothetical protein
MIEFTNFYQDSKGLIDLFGKANFVQQLDIMFKKSKNYLNWNFLPNPYYWAGNEHDLVRDIIIYPRDTFGCLMTQIDLI